MNLQPTPINGRPGNSRPSAIPGIAGGRIIGVPTVTELRPRLEPVTRDPFIDAVARS